MRQCHPSFGCPPDFGKTSVGGVLRISTFEQIRAATTKQVAELVRNSAGLCSEALQSLQSA